MSFTETVRLKVYWNTTYTTEPDGSITVQQDAPDGYLIIDRMLDFAELVDKVCGVMEVDREGLYIDFSLVWTERSGKRSRVHINNDNTVRFIYLCADTWPELYPENIERIGLVYANTSGQDIGASTSGSRTVEDNEDEDGDEDEDKDEDEDEDEDGGGVESSDDEYVPSDEDSDDDTDFESSSSVPYVFDDISGWDKTLEEVDCDGIKMWDGNPLTLGLDVHFTNKPVAQAAVGEWNLVHGRTFRVKTSSKRTWYVECETCGPKYPKERLHGYDCLWKARVSLQKATGTWKMVGHNARACPYVRVCARWGSLDHDAVECPFSHPPADRTAIDKLYDPYGIRGVPNINSDDSDDGFQTEESRLTSVSITDIKTHKENNPLTDQSPDDPHLHRARCFVRWLVGGLLFSNTTRNSFQLDLVHFLHTPEICSEYSWGSAALCYLYRSMSKSSLAASTKAITGCVNLLQGLSCGTGHMAISDRVIYGDVVAPHNPNRVFRQFGYHQRIPGGALLLTAGEITSLLKRKPFGGSDRRWIQQLWIYLQVWNDHHGRLVGTDDYYVGEPTADPEYLLWYHQVTVKYVTDPMDSENARGFHGSAETLRLMATLMEDVRSLSIIGQRTFDADSFGYGRLGEIAQDAERALSVNATNVVRHDLDRHVETSQPQFGDAFIEFSGFQQSSLDGQSIHYTSNFLSSMFEGVAGQHQADDLAGGERESQDEDEAEDEAEDADQDDQFEGQGYQRHEE
ncbi:OLC1v1018913C1 [Oldenlandia corymbosa var. corymbosa]|uniref:OLC1v1018913C1 n=1 Tax=Oldenlandia corymbosa var. corymbosa TaxID=529605 RepID=A0AAV1ECV7_OLDCO|nr:OLC1v1018913C1 [Oldenlandia corymbosa var. corymbosa]